MEIEKLLKISINDEVAAWIFENSWQEFFQYFRDIRLDVLLSNDGNIL